LSNKDIIMKKIFLLIVFGILIGNAEAQNQFTNAYICQDTLTPNLSTSDIKPTTNGWRVAMFAFNGFYDPARLILADIDWQGNISVLNAIDYNSDAVNSRVSITPDGGCFLFCGPDAEGWHTFMRVDSLGSLAWAKKFYIPNTLLVTYANYNIIGNDTVLFAGGEYFSGSTTNSKESWMATLDYQGNLLRVQTIGDGANGYELPKLVTRTSDGGMLVNCVYSSSASSSPYSYVTYKVDSMQNVQWSRLYSLFNIVNNRINRTLELPGNKGYLTTVNSAGSGMMVTYFIRTDTLGEVISYQTLPGYLRIDGMQLINDSTVFYSGLSDFGYGIYKGDTSGAVNDMKFMEIDTLGPFLTRLTYNPAASKFLFWGENMAGLLDSTGMGLCRVGATPTPIASPTSLVVYQYPVSSVNLSLTLSDTIFNSVPINILATTICQTTGITSSEINTNIKAYPNPAHDNINITGLFYKQEYTLYNLDGRKIKEGVVSESENNISLKSLRSGMYVLRIANINLKVVID
jgi:hypothetical protein